VDLRLLLPVQPSQQLFIVHTAKRFRPTITRLTQPHLIMHFCLALELALGLYFAPRPLSLRKVKEQADLHTLSPLLTVTDTARGMTIRPHYERVQKTDYSSDGGVESLRLTALTPGIAKVHTYRSASVRTMR
jgi:hypothetical protein